MVIRYISNSVNKEHIWQKLKRKQSGIFVLAPMADVTDYAFRSVINKYGKPDVLWTEFVSADGLAHSIAREKLLVDLKFDKAEHPIVAQIFGSNPENIKSASALCKELGFDGVDINMGCPDKTIEKQGAGASMIKDISKMKKIIASARLGAGDLPVSVKTRIGYNKNEIDTWIRALLEMKLPLLTVHLRTRKEMSLVPAHWELMPEIIKLRNKISPDTLIIGNGDVLSIDEAKQKIKDTGCDGVMIGRGIFGNPWLFADKTKSPSIEQKLKVMLEHTKLYEKTFSGIKNFAIMKKHYKAYVNGFEGAKELRVKLMDSTSYSEVKNIVDEFLKKL